jgi:Arc/MetJ-type ribon-helix-helix transcriptional regulator
MMILCFECPSTTKKAIDSLISKGTYSDYSEVIAAAVHNLEVLESVEKDRGALFFNSSVIASFSEGVDKNLAGRVRRDVKRRSEAAPGHTSSRFDGESECVAVPPIFAHVDVPGTPQGLLAVSDGELAGEVPVNEWIFGQYSKLLPAKAACRALANLGVRDPGGFDLNEVAASIAAEAATLTRYLAAIDEREGFIRDERLFLGFPSNRVNADRSRLRFANQYVGSVSHDDLTGMLSEFKLAGFDSRSKFQLTEAGWRFAALANPAIDENLGERFSHEEIEFLISHIREHIHSEDFAYRIILRAISAGSNTPEKLDHECKKYVPEDRDGDLSDAFITTQRTGVVSRLNELGLIERHRDGIKVTYFLTDRGSQYK